MKIHNDDEAHLTLGWTLDKLQPPQWTACLVVKGTYPLLGQNKGKWAEEAPKPREPMGTLTADDSGQGSPATPSDLAPVKMNGEFFVKGTAFPPGGQPAQVFPVGVSISSQNKQLNVFGHRVWSDNLLRRSISEPEPLDSLPLQWEYAYGGPDYSKNPLGMGYGGGALPHLEYPDQPISQPNGKYLPAGFGPLGDDWEPRSRMRGTYRKGWLKTRWPWRPDNFDWAFYNQAPLDQQIQGYFRGNEAIQLTNLHPTEPQIQTALPGQAARLFILFKSNDETPGAVREVPLKLDTVHIDTDEELLCLNWRGSLPVQSIKLKEVERILIISEPLENARDAAFYQRRLLELAEEEKAVHTFPMEEHMAEIEAMKASIHQSLEDGLKEGEKEKNEATKQMADGTKDERKALEKDSQKLPQDHKEQIMNAWDKPESLAHHSAEPDENVIQSSIHESRAEEFSNYQKAKTDSESKEAEMLAEAKAADSEGDKLNASINKLIGDGLYKSYADAGVVPPLAEGEEPPYSLGDTMTREQVQTLARAKVHFSVQTFEELDLSGIDFSGIEFNMVTFRQCNLAEAKFQGARFTAVTVEECLCQATDFSYLQMERSRFEQCDLSSSKLGHLSGQLVTFELCALDSPQMEGWKGQLWSLARLDLSGKQMSNCELDLVDFSKSQLEATRFTNCSLASADFDGARASKAVFKNCCLDNLRSSAATSFAGADFSACTGEAPLFSDADCTATHFRRVAFPHAAFNDSKLSQADFSYANLMESVFDGADASNTSFIYANLIRSSFGNAILVNADFAQANLYQSGFLDATIHNCDFSGANLKHSLVANYLNGAYPVALNLPDHD